MNLFKLFCSVICMGFCGGASAAWNDPNNDRFNVYEAFPNQANARLTFPADFEFGVATAAYQIEGAWDADGKGPSIWDTYTHQHPELIADGSNGDIAANSYKFFEEDIDVIKQMGMNFYRLSISWSRVLPDGDIANVNEHGIQYYNKVIDKLLQNGIKPVVTMYHYDLPENLQKFGGLTNSIIIDYFQAYANLLFQRFGDRVKSWITFNEPFQFCLEGYGTGTKAPKVVGNGIGEYLCGHNVLKAHATVYRLYGQYYRTQQQGKIGIALNPIFYYSSENDFAAVDRALQFHTGWFAHPIFSEKGGYPDIMVNEIEKNRIREGRLWSRLPEFSQEWREMIRGSADFLGLNYYTSRMVEFTNTPEGPNPSFDHDTMIKYSTLPGWKQARSTWLYSVPSGIGDLLRFVPFVRGGRWTA